MDYLPPRSAAGTKKIMEGHRKGRTKPSNLREQVDPETMKMYPTPTAQDHSRNTVPPSTGKSRGMDLSMKVVADEIERQKKMYPTPQRSDHLHNQSETLEAWEKRAKQKKEEKGIHLQFALRHAVQRDEREKRMYPTPTQDSASERTKKYKQGGKPLTVAVQEEEKKKMYPTPRASAAMNENLETVRKRVERRGKLGTKLEETMAMELPKMYPTPTVGCEEGGEQSSRVERTKSGGFILRKKNKPNSTFGAKLSDAMLYMEKMYPTPTQRDWKDMAYNPITNNNSRKLLPQVALKHNKPGGKLNPTFVEFLMGFPMNWTKTEPIESKPSVTQSSHKSQGSSD